MSFKDNYVPDKNYQWDFSLSSNPLGPSPNVRRALVQALSNSNALSPYPELGYPDLTQSIASFYNVSQKEVILGAGLDGLIFDIINLLLNPDDELILPTVTFRNAIYAAKARGATVTQVPMKPDLSIDFDQLIQKINSKTKIVFLCNPNNPTGIYESLQFIRHLLESTNALVILDEANIEFSGESALPLIKTFPNLMVLRTFSKAYGLAGIRVGYGISLFPLLMKLPSSRPPFFISILSKIAAYNALIEQEYLQKSIKFIVKERDFLNIELESLGFTVVPSESNTLLCLIPKTISTASSLIEKMHQHDCHAVNGTYFNLEDTYLRIAPNLREANEKLITIFKKII